ncbi:MAG TPA: hypothetical protein VG867_05430, partial [Rhizomicrobium sp.]|nr:hypothetical protein [Rhizomicrobium sp.]
MTVRLPIVDDCMPYSGDIAEIVRAAFAQKYGSGDGEVALIAALRADGDVVVELAALDGDDVVGHVMFSTLTVEPA